MSNIPETGLDRHTLFLLIALFDHGLKPEALTALVRELSPPPSKEPISSSSSRAGLYQPYFLPCLPSVEPHLARVTFHHPFRYKRQKELFITAGASAHPPPFLAVVTEFLESMTPRAMNSRHAVESCTLQLHARKPFQLHAQKPFQLQTLGVEPTLRQTQEARRRETEGATPINPSVSPSFFSPLYSFIKDRSKDHHEPLLWCPPRPRPRPHRLRRPLPGPRRPLCCAPLRP